MKSVAVSFSGGTDSTVVLAAAVKMLPDGHVAVFADIPTLSERQRRTALDVAGELGADIAVARLCWDCMPGVRDNTAERCYLCKKAIYSAVRGIGSDRGCSVLADGENASDIPEERPGRRAAAEFGIVSPLKELGFSRDAVRKMFIGLRLSTDVLKETCMATRFRTGVPFGDSDIRHIDECEELIRDISGVRQIRMRIREDHAELFALPSEIPLLMLREHELSSALLEKGVQNIKISAKGYLE
jgi:uncharacterized protein